MKKCTFSLITTVAFLFLVACSGDGEKNIANDESSAAKKRNVPGLGIQRGLVKNNAPEDDGYILFSPTNSASTYLMNRKGEIVHEWKGYFDSWLAYLQDNGNVIRNVADPDAPIYYAGGMAGRMDEISWDGETVWEFEYATEAHQNHHDLAILPNGNILAISWERKSAEEVIAAGRKQEYTPADGIWMDKIIEIEPIKPRGAKIVWEWKFWDHLIQNSDPALPNFGNPQDHPELLDINAGAHKVEPMHPDTLSKRKRDGDAHRNMTIGSNDSDAYHSNAITYNAELDQIALSVPHINEIFIIDHSTTIQEAANHSGGKYGRGGDFLYRWGNPQNYGRGDSTDQKLFYQHDVRWIDRGYPGEMHLTLYNNQIPNGPDSMKYSAIFEIVTPINADGNYSISENGTYGPENPIWTYVAADTVSLYSPFTSGAQRMKNGNTFILAGAGGRFLEVNKEGETIWEYWNPYRGNLLQPNGDPVRDDPFMYWQFRSNFIPADHPGLVGKNLQPLDPQPEVFIYNPEK